MIIRGRRTSSRTASPSPTRSAGHAPGHARPQELARVRVREAEHVAAETWDTTKTTPQPPASAHVHGKRSAYYYLHGPPVRGATRISGGLGVASGQRLAARRQVVRAITYRVFTRRSGDP